MNLATSLFLFYITYLVFTYFKIIVSKKNRESHKKTRTRLEELRNIAYKTQEEQKEFINLKYPRSPSFKWTFKNITNIILKLASMISIYVGIKYLWINYVMFEFELWNVFIIMIILPILINKILKKYNLQQDDILVFFR